MRSKPGTSDPSSAERLVKDIRRATRRQFSAEEKISIVLDGLRGEAPLAELCRREGIADSLYHCWSKEFLEAGKRHLTGDAARSATTDEIKTLRSEALDLKRSSPNRPSNCACDARANVHYRFTYQTRRVPTMRRRTVFLSASNDWGGRSQVYAFWPPPFHN